MMNGKTSTNLCIGENDDSDESIIHHVRQSPRKNNSITVKYKEQESSSSSGNEYKKPKLKFQDSSEISDEDSISDHKHSSKELANNISSHKLPRITTPNKKHPLEKSLTASPKTPTRSSPRKFGNDSHIRKSDLRKSVLSPRTPRTSVAASTTRSPRTPLTMKALGSPCKSPRTPRTPVGKPLLRSLYGTPTTPNDRIGNGEITVETTPYSLRKRTKQVISQMVESDESDFSASESEYEVDEDNTSSSEEVSVIKSSSSDFSDESIIPSRKNTISKKGSAKSKRKVEIMSDTGSSDEDFSPSRKSRIRQPPKSKQLSESSSSDSDHLDNSKENMKDLRIILTKLEHTPERAKETFSIVQKKELKYIPNSDEYFSRARSKGITSNRSMQRVNKLCDESELLEAISELKITHEKEIKKLITQHKQRFARWMLEMSQGFNILLHGVGSKYSLLRDFQEAFLEHHTVLVVNGFFPDLTLKEIVTNIAKDILDLDGIPTNVHSCVKAIETEFSLDPSLELFIIVHNIDGQVFRNEESQDLLSRLAAISSVHVIASVDYINCGLLWNHTQRHRFNFLFYDVTTLLPYTAETSFEGSFAMRKTSTLALSSLRNVFRSLTSNAKQVFLKIAKHQLDNVSNSSYTGLPFRSLYRSCREDLIVSSDLALRAQLTEFLDHKLLKNRRGVDGSETLHIPINHNTLRCFIDEHGS